MTNRGAFETLDHWDLTGSDHPMGHKCVLLCGDFRQILPVIQGGIQGDACLKRSHLWNSVVVKQLQCYTSCTVCNYKKVKSNPKQTSFKKSVRSQEGHSAKRCEIQGGSQEMVVM